MEFYKGCQKVSIKNTVIRNQFERCSLCIVLNVAEGAGRITERDRRKFFSITFRSLRETQCLLMILQQDHLLTDSESVAACLYKLIQNPGCLIA
ncbi:MAG: four helix bundle protein [Halobacteriovoraceae bacterium]|nr:four helix bundle protein [Halobacteriovoraceae bacterium]